MKKEWDALRTNGAWNENDVQDWDTIRQGALSGGTTGHVGRVFGVCVEKGPELPQNHVGRTDKGRADFKGNSVQGEKSYTVLFNDFGNSPATVTDGSFADFYGTLWGTPSSRPTPPGHIFRRRSWEQTHVRLPRDKWPVAWSGLKHPVVPLLLALYGHPDVGSGWEA